MPHAGGMRIHEVRQSAWLSSRDIDRGRAWPIERWQVFTNCANADPLVITVVNPSDSHAMQVELFVFYEPVKQGPPW